MKRSTAIAVTTLGAIVSSVAAVPLPASAAAAKANSSCAKEGQRAKAGAQTLVCSKVGKKLVWRVAPATTTTAPSATVPTTRASAPQSADQSDIVIGGIYSRTGAQPYVSAYEAADAFFKNLNANGGINGRKIKWIGIDDGTDAQKNSVAMKRLIEQEKAVAVIGLSEISIVGGIPIAKAAGVPYIGCYSAPICFQTDTVYPIGSFYTNSIAAMMTSLLQANRNTKLALLTVQASSALNGKAAYRRLAPTKGIDIVSDQEFAASETDFTAYAAKIIASGAAFVACNCRAVDVVAANNALKQQGYSGDFLAPSFDATYPERIGSYANGRFYLASVLAGVGAGAAGEDMQKIMAKYAPDAQSDVFGALASWTTAELLVEALNGLGTKPVTSTNLMAQLDTFKDVKTTYAPPITYNAGLKKDPTNCIQTLLVTGGKFVPATGTRFNCWTGSVAP